ncbi:MAG: cytochrome P450 [Solirubrobacterales bacterium]|nr:cytochrome P450 [Solirubrobacterales bacterium]
MPPANLPPGPRYPALLQGVGIWTRPLAFLERCRDRYGHRFTIRLPASPPFVMITRPEEIKEIFTAPADVLAPGRGARVLEPIVGSTSVILLDGGAHMEQRRLMLPAFHGERMERLAGLVAAVAERDIASWPAERPLELHSPLQRLTLEIILRAVFGLEPGPRLDALRDRLGAMLAFGDRAISLMPPPVNSRLASLLRRVGPFASFWRLRQNADRLVYELISERRREQREHPDRHERRDDVLAMLLEARHEDGSTLSPDELRDELMTLLVAGHETTASSLAWALQCLGRDPRALRALRFELRSSDEDEAYLLAVIQETLRHRPVLPNVAPRLLLAPFEVGGVMYPPGACLVANAYLLHHDETVYAEPYAFLPERWLDEERKVRTPGTYTWIPFGGGRRRCLGASFALLEMRIVLRTLLRSRELRPLDGRLELPRRRNITIKPALGARASLPRRDPATRVATPA